MLVVGITGWHAAGKSTARRLLEDHGFCGIDTSELVRTFLQSKGVRATERNVRALAGHPRCEHRRSGRLQLVEELRTHQRAGAKRVVVEPVFHVDTIIAIRSGVNCTYFTVGVLAPRQVRAERLGRVQLEPVERVLDEKDAWLRSLGVAETLRQADVIVVNDGTLEEFEARLEAAMEWMEGRGNRTG